MSEIIVKGKIRDVRIARDPENDSDIVHFKLYDDGEHSVLRGLECYCFPSHETTDKIEKGVFNDKVMCVSGCICADERGADFQVHSMWVEPEYIYMH